MFAWETKKSKSPPASVDVIQACCASWEAATTKADRRDDTFSPAMTEKCLDLCFHMSPIDCGEIWSRRTVKQPPVAGQLSGISVAAPH